ncbi:MAG: phytoene desaturase [Chitinophagaceae bacterium]|nr:phytoene desaturase [Chitinophagaceae bacterium]MCA6452088.1 phytoene desaturase [Chitinophagaceae bacterium]MCA6457245.1 phytoene desaturase [Chitinophagaceae bacterium]MCA6459906.1 phytoene desaturase [Chitinophagaceae bacterium]MCA6465765.1 phytoene desaturase [Chitinophagaceae bacterium]
MSRKVVVIGSGFAGLSAASFMARAGWDVTVLEKHAIPGGRARYLKAEGFTFDMGPSWYWMPDVFERYFACFGKNVSDYYRLIRLDPSYRVYYPDGPMDVPADLSALQELFESMEPGAGKQLQKFLEEAAYKYEVGINKLVFKPGQSVKEFLDWDLAKGLFKLDVFRSMKAHVAKYFKHPKLVELMEFPVLFLGALPEKTPALYSLMNYADIKGGTWFPEKGMYQIVQAMYDLAVELGVRFEFEQEVTAIDITGSRAKSVQAKTPQGATVSYDADVVIGGADYHHIETQLLPVASRSYTDAYWDSRVMAPGCILYYVGLNKKLNNIQHHSLFFDTSFAIHGKEIYDTKQWPSNPLFYVSAVSVTDPSSAPEGCENLFLLIPVATGLENDTEELRERYFDQIVTRMEKHLGQSIKDAVIYQKSFAHSDFISEYHAFKGNAYGLANTLQQTAVLKPSCRSKKVSNLFYTGQLTVPGPGVPPSLISGEVVAGEVVKAFGKA